MKVESRFEGLSDEELLARLPDLVARSRRVEAELVAHLAEVDARRLYLGQACSSMHVYATERLHLSDAEAYLRITVARLSRRVPLVLEMLGDGRLHLSGIARLAPHVTDEGGEALLLRAAHLSRRAIEVLVAEIAPRPDVPARIRRLPGPIAAAELCPDRAPAQSAAELVPGGAVLPAGSAPAIEDCAAELRRDCPDRVAPPARPASVVAPLAPSRYRVQFTAGAELREKLERAQALLRRQVPDGDLAAIVDRAVTLLLGELERAKYAATGAPRKTADEADPTPSSRRITAPIRRAVWARDGGQCTYRGGRGRRCSARDRLEFHHVVPFGQGGDHNLENVRLACSSHNRCQAELDYGAVFMAARRRQTGGAGRASEPALGRRDGPRWRASNPEADGRRWAAGGGGIRPVDPGAGLAPASGFRRLSGRLLPERTPGRMEVRYVNTSEHASAG